MEGMTLGRENNNIFFLYWYNFWNWILEKDQLTQLSVVLKFFYQYAMRCGSTLLSIYIIINLQHPVTLNITGMYSFPAC